MRALVAEVLDYAPLLATAFAIPQFLPQLFKLWRSGDVAGVSWSWAMLTSVSNAAWFVYFALSHFWTALAPSSSAALLAGALALMLARRRQARLRQAVAICAWTALLAGSFGFAGRTGLGTLLAASFVLQVIPSIWTAYRTSNPSGISRGTWLLIFVELFCWAAYGLHKADPRLIVLGCTGVTASALILARSLLSTRQDPDDSSARARARAMTPATSSGRRSPSMAGSCRNSARRRWRLSRSHPFPHHHQRRSRDLPTLAWLDLRQRRRRLRGVPPR
jgi:uncharacterized protein with PQ loop repeat